MAGEPGERRGAHGSTGEGAQPGPPLSPQHTPRGGAPGEGAARPWWWLHEVPAAPRGLRGVSGGWDGSMGCAGHGGVMGGGVAPGDVQSLGIFGGWHRTLRCSGHGCLGRCIAPGDLQSMVFFGGGALHPELYRAWWVLGGWHHTLSYTDHSIFWGWHHNPKPPRAWQSLRAACTAPRAVAGDFWGGSLAP